MATPLDKSDERTQWGIVILVLLAGMIAAFQIGKLPASLPALRRELNIGLVSAGWIVSITHAIAFVFGIVAGSIADWLGHRRIIIASLFAVAAASAYGAVSDSIISILLSRFLEGFGLILIFAAGPVLISRVAVARQRGLVLGFWSIHLPLGISLMILLTPLLLTAFGWRGVWWSNSTLLFIFGIVMWAGLHRDRFGKENPDIRYILQGIRLTLSAPGAILLAITFATATANSMAVFAFLPSYLIESQGSSQGIAATLTAAAFTTSAIASMFSSWLLHRNVPRWGQLVTAFLVMGISSVWIYADDVSTLGRYLFSSVFFVAIGVVPAMVFSGVPLHSPKPELIGMTNGLILQGSNFGFLVGPPLFAALVSSFDWTAGFWFTCGVSALGLSCAIGLRRLETARESC